jgi:hypothetical protein
VRPTGRANLWRRGGCRYGLSPLSR